jgi:hypothetical protein
MEQKMNALPPASVKVIGANGQISLGKQFAGRQVLVEEREPGVWLVRTAKVVPDNEAWVHEPEAARDLKEAMDWAATNPPNSRNAEEILAKLTENG